MPRHWLFSISEDNYLITSKHSLIGITKHGRKVIYRMAAGDMITFYISRKTVNARHNDPRQQVRKIRGIAIVQGEAFESDEAIWHTIHGEIYSHRRYIKFLSDASIDAQPILEKLSYVTNTKYWGLPLRRGYVEITVNDFETIQEAMQASLVDDIGIP